MLSDIWRVCLEILPLQKSKEKPDRNLGKTNKTGEELRKHVFSIIFRSLFRMFKENKENGKKLDKLTILWKTIKNYASLLFHSFPLF